MFTIQNNGEWLGLHMIPLANIRWVDMYPHPYVIYAYVNYNNNLLLTSKQTIL